MHRRVRSVAGAAIALLVAIGVAPAAAAGSPMAGSPDMSEAELQRLERRLLGPAHAEEHRQERLAARQEAAGANGRSARVAAADAVVVQAADAATDGVWRSAFPIPVVGVHAALLPTGKVMLYSQRINDYKGDAAAAYLWDPTKAPGAAGEFKSVTPALNIWCGAQSLMADGQLLVTGGNLVYATSTTGYKGLKSVFTFDPWSETWTRQPDMPRGRWYPTQTLLPDGRTMITSGYDEVGGYAWNTDIDVFNPPATRGGQGSITTIARYGQLANSPSSPHWYPHWFVMPSGGVLNAGFKRDESWLLQTTPGAVRGFDRPNWSMHRKYGSAVLLPGTASGSTRVMQLGGYDHSTTQKASVTSTEVFDESAPTVAPSAGPTMRVARSHQNTVLLPDRSMVNIGGGSGEQPGTEAPENANNRLAAAGLEHRQVEILDRGSSTWRLGPAQAYKRSYHSTALLLPDGRVLSAGDDRDPAKGTTYRERDLGEIYEPAYLHKAGERPSIVSAPSAVGYGQRFHIDTSSAISSAVLVAPGTTTHANDMGQRLAPLSITPDTDGGGAELVSPPNANVAPPGYYMLFALSANGKPSVAEWVRVGGGTPPPADTTAPTAPTNLVATPGNGSVSLSWAASTSTDTVRYDVHRTAPGTRTKVSPSSQGTGRTFTDTGLTNGTTYSYVVRAVDGAANESADSGSASATPTAGGGGTRTITLTPAADTMAKEASPGTNFGTSTTLKVDSQELSTSGSRVHGYLRFEVPTLAAGETVTGASLRLAVSNATTNGPAIYRTSADWGEATLSWSSTDPARSPATAVGNYGSMATGAVSTAVSGITGAGPVSLELAPESGDGLDFGSRESGTAGNRPQLVLTVASGSSPPPPPPGSRTVTLTAVADTMVKQASPTTGFGGVTPLKVDGQELSTAGSSVISYLRFDVPALANGETITAASLRLSVSNATANGPAVYRTDAGWSETGLTWNGSRPARISTATVGNFGSMGTGGVTTGISGLTAGGLLSLELAPETGDGLDFASRENGTAGNRPQLTLTIASGGG